jgi:hypothetical protein
MYEIQPSEFWRRTTEIFFESTLSFAKSLCPKLKEFFLFWRKPFGLGLQADSSTRERCSLRRHARNTTQNTLCRAVNRRRGGCACRASNCRRRARFSRTRSSRERKTLTNQPRKCRSDTIMARILAEKSESRFSPNHSFCRCMTFWRGTRQREKSKKLGKAPVPASLLAHNLPQRRIPPLPPPSKAPRSGTNKFWSDDLRRSPRPPSSKLAPVGVPCRKTFNSNSPSSLPPICG